MELNYIIEKNRIYAENENKKVIAEITFPKNTEGILEINHTFVDDSLRGQGIAGKLMENTIDSLRKTNRKAKAVCSYAVSWVSKNKEKCSDVIIE